MNSMAFRLMASQEASTKRSPAIAGGKIGAPVTNLASIKVTPLMPLDAETRERHEIEAASDMWVAYCEGALDIDTGDILIVDSTNYYIIASGPWPTDEAFLELITTAEQ